MRNQLASDINENTTPVKSEAQETLEMLTKAIDSLPPSTKAHVTSLAQSIRALVKDNGGFGDLALALVGGEREVEIQSEKVKNR